MSDRQKGAKRVRVVENRFNDLGFRTMISSSSGQRRGARGSSLALDGDIMALAPDDSGWPHLLAEVGGRGKSVRASLAEMRAQGPLPGGFIPIVVRLVDPRTRKPGAGWRWHLSSDEAYETVDDLLDAVVAE